MDKTESFLLEKIDNLSARVAVIGLGYVGLPLAAEYANAGYQVTGFDVSREKIDHIHKHASYILDVTSEDLKKLVESGNLKGTNDFSLLSEMDTINICVPTPLRKTKDPDVSFIVEAVERIEKMLRKGQLIILESTTYPGTTNELILPMLERKGLRVGKDFFLAFSPERVDPGNESFITKNIPKVVGGVTPQCTRLAERLYSKCISKVVPVSSTYVAEMVKLLENTFRAVNIGMVNEIALMCNHMGINVWEVIDAAATKPFGFMPFYPGPGLGGHCIPIDPFYLSWKAKMTGFEARFIELAGQINKDMPFYVVHKITDALNDYQKSVKGSRILITGVAYKKDIDDVRESPALDIIEILQAKGAEISFYDPYVMNLQVKDQLLISRELNPATLGEFDCVAIITDHTSVDYDMIAKHSKVIVDTRNALKDHRAKNIYRI
jgi:UDP-N-acetyl-D-glucosamine dehydrogenase